MTVCSYAIDTSDGVAYQASPYITSVNVNTPPGKIAPSPPSFDVNSDVSFNRLGGVSADNPGGASAFRPQTFSAQVLNATDVLAPDTYTGDTSSSCVDGLEVTIAADRNDIVLSYTPPAPPQLNLDIAFPDRPDFSVQNVLIPVSNLSADALATLPEMFTFLEGEASSLLTNVLEYLSEDPANSFNEKLYRGSAALHLTLRGISAPAARDFTTKEARDRQAFARDLSILNRKANNALTAQSLTESLETTARESHTEHQAAVLAVAKANMGLALQNMSLAVMLFNVEVNQALLDYQEFSKIAQIELEKLDIFNAQLKSLDTAISGNTELMDAYKKQVSIVKQVFDSFEDSMKLSEVVLNLATTQIQIETANVKTSTLLIEGETDKAQNSALSAQNRARAHGMTTEAEVAKGGVDVVAARTRLESSILTSNVNIKNNLIDSENVYLQSLADSVSSKLANVKSLFDLDIVGHSTDATLSFLSSHSRSLDQANQQEGRLATAKNTHSSAINSLGIPSGSLQARRAAWQRRVNSLNTYNSDVETAANTLRIAAQTQELIHTITSN